MEKERKQEEGRGEAGGGDLLVLFCGFGVTRHEIDSGFLSWGRSLGQSRECSSFEVGPNTCVTHKQVSTLLPQKGLL